MSHATVRQLMPEGHKVSQDSQHWAPKDRLHVDAGSLRNGGQCPDTVPGPEQTSATSSRKRTILPPPAPKSFLRLAPDPNHTQQSRPSVQTHERPSLQLPRLSSVSRKMTTSPACSHGEAQGHRSLPAACRVPGPGYSPHHAALSHPHPTVMSALINPLLQQTGHVFRKANMWLVNTCGYPFLTESA